MSTKKLLLIIGGVFAVLVLIVALFVGAIAFFAVRAIGSSQAADTARTYLRSNQVLKQDIGEVKDFGWIVTGNVNTQNDDGEATLYLKTIGEKHTVKVRVDLSYRNNRSWRVTGASYDRDGKYVDLMGGYEPSTPTDSPSK